MYDTVKIDTSIQLNVKNKEIIIELIACIFKDKQCIAPLGMLASAASTKAV